MGSCKSRPKIEDDESALADLYRSIHVEKSSTAVAEEIPRRALRCQQPPPPDAQISLPSLLEEWYADKYCMMDRGGSTDGLIENKHLSKTMDSLGFSGDLTTLDGIINQRAIYPSVLLQFFDTPSLLSLGCVSRRFSRMAKAAGEYRVLRFVEKCKLDDAERLKVMAEEKGWQHRLFEGIEWSMQSLIANGIDYGWFGYRPKHLTLPNGNLVISGKDGCLLVLSSTKTGTPSIDRYVPPFIRDYVPRELRFSAGYLIAIDNNGGEDNLVCQVWKVDDTFEHLTFVESVGFGRTMCYWKVSAARDEPIVYAFRCGDNGCDIWQYNFEKRRSSAVPFHFPKSWFLSSLTIDGDFIFLVVRFPKNRPGAIRINRSTMQVSNIFSVPWPLAFNWPGNHDSPHRINFCLRCARDFVGE